MTDGAQTNLKSKPIITNKPRLIARRIIHTAAHKLSKEVASFLASIANKVTVDNQPLIPYCVSFCKSYQNPKEIDPQKSKNPAYIIQFTLGRTKQEAINKLNHLNKSIRNRIREIAPKLSGITLEQLMNPSSILPEAKARKAVGSAKARVDNVIAKLNQSPDNFQHAVSHISVKWADKLAPLKLLIKLGRLKPESVAKFVKENSLLGVNS